jgi:gamma-glutamylcyclotransferase (GGCT)/AIG2-like uncharacterized protein YtfP
VSNVFTYGSLMYPQVWDRVVRGRYASAPARLPGYRRLALVSASYPGIVASDGASVDGRVWFDVAGDDLARLDAFEADEYRRDTVRVTLRGPDGEPAEIDAQAYVFTDPRKLAEHDWDVERFEREQLAAFVAQNVLARTGQR